MGTMAVQRRLAGILCLVIILGGGRVGPAHAGSAASQPEKGQAVTAKETVAEILEPQSAQAGTQLAETPAQRAARLAWWQDARLGLFVTWGPVSLTGQEIGWSRGGQRRDGSGAGGGIPAEIYDNLYKHFNPSCFDAAAFVQAAKDAGAKYVIFLMKHHDGFCLWNTQTTDYKITSPLSPFGRDIAREIADACHAAGLKLIWYFSLGDWHDPDYYTASHDRFTARVMEQIRELCSNYGRIDGFWFDLWYSKMAEDNLSQKISNLIHKLQPGAVINNRGGLAADYDTPEQRIGAFQIKRPWESCMTLGTSWAWKSKDTIKSLAECLSMLVNAAGGDGNLALNVGPMPDGRIEPRQVERLKEIGGWLGKYGKSIYGTRGGPFMPGDYGASTHRGNTIYLHVLQWDGRCVTLPPINQQIVASSLLTGGDVNVRQSADEIVITVDPQHHQPVDTIVMLQLDGLASQVVPVVTASDTLAFRKPAQASGADGDATGPEKAFDGDLKTGWSAPAGARQGWLEVDLGQDRTVAQAVIYEGVPGRIKQFELQHQTDGDWLTAYRGSELGAQAIVRFKPVNARHFRLNVMAADDRPSILEFKLTGPMAAVTQEYTTHSSAVSDEAWAAVLKRWVKVGASQVHGNLRQYGPDKLIDGNRWIAGNCQTAWLDEDFGRPRTINQAIIYSNRYWQSVKQFELQRQVAGEWQTFYSTTTLNEGTLKLDFEPVTLTEIRMKITMKGNDYIEAYKLELVNTAETKP
jgi:alpha-L-fucosidase